METIKNVIASSLQDPNFILNMILHSLILFTFLTVFFNFFIVELSEKAFKDEITHLMEGGLNKIELDGVAEKTLLSALPLDKIEKKLQEKDKTVSALNKGLMNTLWTANIILWIVLIIGIFITHKVYGLHLSEIITENVLTFVLVGIAEYLFFTQIAFKFIPVEPSFISKQFIEKVKAKF